MSSSLSRSLSTPASILPSPGSVPIDTTDPTGEAGGEAAGEDAIATEPDPADPAGEVGEAEEPAGEAADPTGEDADPTDEASDAEGEATDPAGEAAEPTGDATEPADEATDPAGEAAEPDDADPSSSNGSTDRPSFSSPFESTTTLPPPLPLLNDRLLALPDFSL